MTYAHYLRRTRCVTHAFFFCAYTKIHQYYLSMCLGGALTVITFFLQSIKSYSFRRNNSCLCRYIFQLNGLVTMFVTHKSQNTIKQMCIIVMFLFHFRSRKLNIYENI